ncbi:MAG TPA: hypothetical protein VFO65_07130, partial [Acidimicrobiales bacterium]|nr:hypothetical protein [Acidimicrobiales bacterium]
VVGGLVALYLAAAVGTAALVRIGDRAAGHHHLVPPPVGALVAELRVTGVEAAFADYWVAYRIPLVTEGRIRASALTDPRSPELERATRSEPRPPYVVFEGECPDRQVQRALAELGVGYGRVVVGAYAVITPERRVMPEQLVREWADQRGRAPAGAAPAHSCLGR